MGRFSGMRLLSSFIMLLIIYGVCQIANAQSPTIVSKYSPPSPDNGLYHGMPLTIAGTVFDADGRPVPGVTVKLWQNGQLVKKGYGPGWNPTRSSLYSPDEFNAEGSYAFSGLYPGDYEMTAEKDSHNTSVKVYVNASKAGFDGVVKVNLWLDDYQAPTWTREQLSSTGAIKGIICDKDGKTIPLAVVTLWQNGQKMNIPHNPRYTYTNGTYSFRFLLPGGYQVVAEAEGHVSLPVNVSVDSGTAYANVSIQDYSTPSYSMPAPSIMMPAPTPTIKATPILMSPTSSADIFAALLSMVLAIVYILKYKK